MDVALTDGDDRWLERHRPYLTLLARSHLNPRHPVKLDASDIVQQTLLDAFAKRDQFRGTTEGEMAAWLREILRNNLRDAIRDRQRDKRDVRKEQSLDLAIDSSFSKTQIWLADMQSSVSTRAVKQEDLSRLSAALTTLPKSQCEAIVLHHLRGLKLADVATEMERSEAAVAGLLFRGLKALQTLLSE